MILLRNFFRAIGASDQPISFFETWRERSKTLFEFVFGTIEGAIVVGALGAVAGKTGSLWLYGMSAVAYLTLLSYVVGEVRLLLHTLLDNSSVDGDKRQTLLTVISIAVFAVGMALPFLFGNIIAQLVNNSVLM